MQPPIQRPLRTNWQQKHVALDVFHPAIQQLGDAAEKFCGNFYANDIHPSLLVMIGDNGFGKTHTLKSIHRFCSMAAQAAFDKGNWGKDKVPSTKYVNWPEVCAEFEKKNDSALPELFAVDLLCIDDIGAESDPWGNCKDKLCQVLTRREQKFTAVTTNIVPENWATRFDNRINDRLIRNASHILIEGVGSYAAFKLSQ